MLPYYLNLNKRLISDKLSETLLGIVKHHIDDFADYKSQSTGKPDGNAYIAYLAPFIHPDLFLHSEINELKKSCALNFSPTFMMHRPNTKVDIHSDDPNGRNCVIITPLFPKVNYVPTRFWEKDKTEPVAVCDFSDFNSALVNTQINHDLKNIDSYRFNLQFCFNEPMKIVADLYQTGKLFKN
jgi:hypothetical protein